MSFCPKCKKEVIQYSIPSGAENSGEIVESMRSWAKKEGKLILFNQFDIQKCPVCSSDLTD
ncbi:Uncharacterised protein [Candidatus Bilamarchaeum dharawalense]|uniref:Uncharacterized protein n=1 Tax=Candidatus Bilamarchaeum dharawalense TaxID=2885759 RepID=A0A5E4LRL4_9ARCH|nr:Uncharacterised protein [Candidatus Bilamarchaeum dharawalense]